MSPAPPATRVTYSNINEDFGPVQDYLDAQMADFESALGARLGNVVGGEVDLDGEAYEALSPIDSDIVLGSFVDASPAAVARAVAAARAAQPAWARRPWSERVAVLRAVADRLAEHKYGLTLGALFEVGKSRLEAMGEVEEAIDLMRFFADEMERNAGYSYELGRALPAERTASVMRPYGVFGVIAPFNFSVALSVKMLSPALVAGNAVVFKPSPGAGVTGAILMRCFAEGGMPAGVVNMVCGERAGARLVDCEGVDGIAFTGSHEVGMGIVRKYAAGRFMRPVIAEMGGKNPAYVTASADLGAAAEGVIRSAFGLQGEKCSAAEVAYVQREVYEPFLATVRELLPRFRCGDPRRRDVFVGPLIDDDALARFETAVEEARRDGSVLLGGARLSGGIHDRGRYVEPTVVGDLPAGHRLLTEELFLPFVALAPFDHLAEAIERGNAVKYGLTAGIYTRSREELDLFLERAEAGVLYANRPHGATTGAWPGFQTFPGWKGSGVSGKGGFGRFDIVQFMREQSHTLLETT